MNKKRIHVDLFVNILLAFLFVVISILFVFIVRGEKSKNRLLMEYETEKELFILSEEVRQERSNLKLPEGVESFGIYDGLGNSMIRFGNAPARINLDELKKKGSSLDHRGNASFYLNGEKALLVLVRLLKKPPPGDERTPRIRPRVFYLEMNVRSYQQREKILSLALILVLGFIGISLLYTRYIYRKNLRYEKKLETQEQLVHLGEAARTLSHEIKNPLGAIRLRTDILKRYVLPEGREDLEVISEEVDRLKGLTERVHDFLKNPLGEPEEIDLLPFINEIIRKLGYEIGLPKVAENCREDLEGKSHPLRVSFDRGRLYSVLENLMRNAVESGSDIEDIVIELGCGGKYIYIDIMDRGTGIDAEIRDAVYNPFFTTKSQGSGIGLSIAKRFVEAAGGSIVLKDREGGGTIARVALKRPA